MIARNRLGAAVALTVALGTGAAHAEGFVTDVLLKQLKMCELVQGFIKAPCAGKILGEEILPHLAPITVEGLRASQTIIDLDSNKWTSTAADWLNSGLDWLGVPDRYKIPKKIGYDFSIGLEITDIKLKLPRDNAYQPEFGAKIKVHLKVLSTGLFQGKTYNPKGTVEGKVYLTVAPHGKNCSGKKSDWAMIFLNVHLTKMDLSFLPDFIDDNKLFLSIVNWALSKTYTDYPEYQTRGYGFCILGKCPPPKKPEAVSGPGVLKLAGATVRNKYIKITLDKNGSPTKIDIDHNLFCKVTNDVVNSGCTDQFVNHLANVVFPLSAPIPESLGVKGLSIEAEKFHLDIKKKNEIDIVATAGIHKVGEKAKFGIALDAHIEIKPECSRDSFLMYMRPRLNGVKLTPIPKWLMDDVTKMALGAHLPSFDVCPANQDAMGKTLNMCELTNELMVERCTGPFVSAVMDGVFPMQARPGDFIKLKDPKLNALLNGIKVSVDKVGVEIPHGGTDRDVRVKVKASIRKDGESKALTTSATLGFHVDTKCGATKSAMRITPSILGVEVSKIPAWLLDSTIVTVANMAIGKTFAACIVGKCSNKNDFAPINPFENLLPKGKPAPKNADDCNFDSFHGGK